jgi:hypothetical protein
MQGARLKSLRTWQWRSRFADGSPEYGRLRLAAIDKIRVREPASAVNVTMAQQTLIGTDAKVTAGYIIKIDQEGRKDD